MSPYRQAAPRLPVPAGARPPPAIRAFAYVDEERLRALQEWLLPLPLDRWPQQHRVDEQLRPAMVNDPEWYDFGSRTFAVVNELLEKLPGSGPTQDYNRMLSCVMPGHSIDRHRDEQEPGWLTRVHVPLTTNPHAVTVVEGVRYHLEVGRAYTVDTRREHAVRNDGGCPRIHFMFDVRRPR